jgi:hypothetical protein
VNVTEPVTYLTMDQRLMIFSKDDSDMLEISFRPPQTADAVKQVVPPTLSGLVRWLGEIGKSHPGAGLDVSYGDVVAILQEMSKKQELLGAYRGNMVTAAFVLQDISSSKDSIYSAPSLEEQVRPQGGTTQPLEPTTLPLETPVAGPTALGSKPQAAGSQ